MNKYLLMSAAAVLASVSAATAAVDKKGNSGVQSVYLTNGSGVAYCDAVTIAWQGVNDQILDQETGCGSGYTGVFGAGSAINTNTKGVGPNSDASNSIENSNLAQLNFDFGTTSTGAPINGGSFSAYATMVTTGGALDTFEYIAGHYYFGKHKRGHHPAISARLAQDGKVRTPVVNGLSVK
jgi:hypothetical protein